MNIRDALSEELRKVERRDLLRKLTQVEGRAGARVTINGRELVLMCGNDYLGLASHPALAVAASDAAMRHGTGSGASRLISGDLPPHGELEQACAALVGMPEAAAFSSGAMANMGLIQALAGPEDAILSDELNHASIVDGCRLSGARKIVYPHLDMDALESGLDAARSCRRRVVVTESLFSMDGDSPQLARTAELCRRHEAWLVIDEAHALGVMGPRGRGLAFEAGATSQAAAIVGTLGKAFGAAGAFVAGPRPLRDYLINTCRTLIFSTAPSPAISAAACAGVRLALGMDLERARLLATASMFREMLAGFGFDVPMGFGPIVPVILGDERAALRAQEILWELGIWAQAIRPPSVPEGKSRLRISLRADLSEEDLAIARSAITELAKRL